MIKLPISIMLFTLALVWSHIPVSLAAEGHGGGQQSQEVALPQVPAPDASQAQVPDGYKVEVVLTGLTYPSSVEFDDQGNMLVAEAGYSYGDPQPRPRILSVSPQGNIRPLPSQGLEGPITDLLWHEGRLFISHRGKISSIAPGGTLQDLVTGLPSGGDHHNNQLTVGPDGMIYFGQGTVTNSGVVGMDNFKMGWLAQHPELHDVPARDIRLRPVTFTSSNPLTSGTQQVETSPYQPFSQTLGQDPTIPGAVKASGTILRMNPDGSGLEVYAWGLRNPYGVLWGADGTLYATENGFDVRGSRPIANDKEDLYVIRQGGWYGWPDYASGLPVTDSRFKPPEWPQPEFIMAEHPPVETPLLTFPAHSAATQIESSRGGAFGADGKLFITFFGHMAPMTGEVDEHAGHRVARVDPQTKAVETFFTKKGEGNGHGGGGHHEGGSGGHGGQQQHESVTAGPRRLMDVRFAPAGDALYIVDFGSMVIEQKLRPIPGTGVIWRVIPQDLNVNQPPANLQVPQGVD